jgi:drug/metabolite transporter (DMT)-like permease
MAETSRSRIFGLTSVALLAFAANSLLCRFALAQQSIDPASFASLRLLSGAAMLGLVMALRSRPAAAGAADWPAAFMLWAYVVCFSFAYLSLSAGTGALILFGAVQLTMSGAGWHAGDRYGLKAWVGLLLALAGLLYLVWPGIASPPPGSAALMAGAGVAWGAYSLRGRRNPDPVAASAGNFQRAAPLALLASALFLPQFHVSAWGSALAITSGALTSGLGYVVWYAALPGLSPMRAATVQLSVPLLTAIAGVLLLSEAMSLRLLLASVAILGGIALAVMGGPRAASARKP